MTRTRFISIELHVHGLFAMSCLHERKKALFRQEERLLVKGWGIELPLHKISLALVSPQVGLTSEFEMGSGVAPPP